MLRKIYWVFFLFLLVSSFSIAQTGPMGIGNKDGTPTSAGPQPKLLLWLDGSSARGINLVGDTIYGNNMPVDIWLDKSGNNHHFHSLKTLQNHCQDPPHCFRPTLYTEGANSGPKGDFLNSKPTPIVKFRNQDDKLICEQFQFSGNGYSIFFVIRNDDNNKYGIFNYATEAHNHAMLIYNDNGIRQIMADTYERNSQMGNLSDIPSSNATINRHPKKWNYGGITWNNTSLTRNWEYKRNDYYESNNFNEFPVGLSVSNIGTATIGDFINIPGGPEEGSFELDIAEIIIFEGRVTRNISRLIRTYFWIKYGLNGENQTWDFFHENMNRNVGKPFGGKYYAPIGIGTDLRTNPGSLYEARSEGLVLRVNEGNYPTEGSSFHSYLVAAPHGNSLTGLEANVITSEGLLAPIIERWSRLWEISGRSTNDDTQIYEIAFDFEQGINGGQIPQNIENFELIFRTDPTSGNFEIVPVVEKFITGTEVVFRVRKEYLKESNPQNPTSKYFTIGTRDNVASSLTGDLKRTWRAYKNGNWNDPLVWTLDGSSVPAYVNPNGSIPKVSDNVYIGAGKKVTVTTDISADEIGIMDHLHVIGTLELTAAATKPTFLNISGSGLIRCAADNFPIGNADAFADPLTGGSLELFGSGGYTITSDIKANNLLVNLSGNVDTTVTLAANLTHYGLFEVRRGSFIINDNTPNIRTITSYGDVFVANANSRIRIQNQGNLGHSHNWYFHGDLKNTNGQIKFTGRGAPADSSQAYMYYTTGEANMQKIVAHFVSGIANQELIANGLSYFSRIVVNKGTDMTYILRIVSNNASKFKLLGRCDQYMTADRAYSTPEQNLNSLATINGTIEVGQNIFIPLLVNPSSGGKYYLINNSAQLWVNGGEVVVGSLGGAAGSSGGNKNGALITYGLIKVTAGNLRSLCNNGILLRQTGMLQIDGGTVTTNQVRTSNIGTPNIGGLIVNGGTLHINPSHWAGNIGSHASLSLKEKDNVFRMSGGTIYITAPTSNGMIFIGADPQNTNITGGTVHLNTINNSANYKITTRAPFWNLTLSSNGIANTNSFQITAGQSGGESSVDTIRSLPPQNLVILNKLLIKGGVNGPKLRLNGDGNSSEASSHLFIHGDLEIENGGSLITNENTVFFVGNSNSSLTLRGSDANPHPFFNVVVNKNMDSRNVNIQNTGPNPVMNILGNLTLERGNFINRGRHVELRGNLINRTQFGDDTGSGELRMVGNSGRQEIESYGGTIHNLVINNSDGVGLQNSSLTIKNYIKLTTGSFYIGDNKLRLETTNGNPIQNFNSTDKFIVCSGNASAGGLEILNHSATQTLTFPIGVFAEEGLKYTNAQIKINSGWAGNGYIRITPVDTLLSTSNLSGDDDYLAYYWKLTTSEYVTKPNVSHRFFYHESDVRGVEENFVSGRVLNSMPFTRSYDNSPTDYHVNTTINRIDYNGPDKAQDMNGDGTPLVDADYSAGSANRFPLGTQPNIYFSNNTTVGAKWDEPSNWNKLNECAGCTSPHNNHSSSQPHASDFPKAGDIAIIGFDASNSFRPHIYKAPEEGIEVSQIVFTPLQDAQGNRLPRYYGNNDGDIGILRPALQISKTSDIVNVGQISGEGELMLTPAILSPFTSEDIDLSVTDIGSFLAEDSSIVVFKPSNMVITDLSYLPNEIPNFFIANGLVTIHNDILVRGNLEIAGKGRLYLSDSRNGNIKIKGNLIMDNYQENTGNTSLYYNKSGTPKTVEIEGDLKIGGTQAYISINPTALPVFDEPWSPDKIDPLLWFDASTGITLDEDGRVAAWESQGSESYTATQPEEDKRPLFFQGINGLNTVHFDGINDFLSVPHDSKLNIPANQNFEIFSVSQTSNVFGQGDTARPIIIGKGDPNNNGYVLYISYISGANTVAKPNHKYRFYMGGDIAIAPYNQGTGFSLGWVRRQGNNGYLFNTIGGTASLSSVGSRKGVNSLPLSLGATYLNSENLYRYMNGQIAEVIFIKRSISHEERQKMEGYLAHKWGFQDELPAGHPYRTKIPMENDKPNATAKLIVHGNIIQKIGAGTTEQNGVKLYHEADSSFVELILTGSGHHQYDIQSGPKARLWKVSVDKGFDYNNSSFTFNAHTDIIGPSDEFIKPVTIQNGLLKFNNPNIDITLSSGGGDFFIPATGGLEINSGELSIKGLQTGLIHSGLLKITDGSLTLGDASGSNNYIEYAGTPIIEITGGDLTVGSQIRRNLSNTSGTLTYKQSGGSVTIGKYTAPEPTRAMLEVVNNGSRFEHTGGTLTFVQGITGAGPSLHLTPTHHNTGGTAEIIIANADSPDDFHIQNFGIQSSIPLNSLTINSNNGPKVHLISNNLELKGNLLINTGATMDAAGRNLTVHGNFTNNGLFNFETATLNLVHENIGTVSGSGIFNLNNLNRTGSSGKTTVETTLLIKGNFTNDTGEIDFGENSITVLGNVSSNGRIAFDNGVGLVLAGSSSQQLICEPSYNMEIDILTINNLSTAGVVIPEGMVVYKINKNLRLERGKLSLNGNTLEIAEGAVFTPIRPFGENNMIVTGDAAVNSGVLLNLPAHYKDDVFVPLGIDRFMPIYLDFSQENYSSGTNPSSYRLQVLVPDNGIADDPENVLGMHFSVESVGIGNGLNMDMKFYYNDQYVRTTSGNTEEDYIAARSLNTDVWKYSVDEVDTEINTITFHHQGDFEGIENAVDGDYFAGIDDAIPANIMEYETLNMGSVTDSIYTPSVIGGGAPTGAVVKFKHNVVVASDNINFYQTIIEEGVTLTIYASDRHRFGKVSGKGTLVLVNTGTLPSGNYTNFLGCGGGKIDFQVNAGFSYEILANMPPIEEVIISGNNGAITFASSPINVCKNLKITGSTVSASNFSTVTVNEDLIVQGGTLDLRQGKALVKGNVVVKSQGSNSGKLSAGNNGKLTIEGDLKLEGTQNSWINLGSDFRETHLQGDLIRTGQTLLQGGTDGAKLVFNGILPQTIIGDFTGSNKIPGVEINNAAGLYLDGNLDVSENLLLTDGNIYTTPSNMLKLTADDVNIEPAGGHPNSFIDGPMRWNLNSGSLERRFPVGRNDRYRPLSISSPTAARLWEVEYRDTSALEVPTITSLLPDPTAVPAIETVSKQEYWRVNTDGGSTEAQIKLSWGDSSAVSQDVGHQSSLVVMAYNHEYSHWDSHGQSDDISYDAATNSGSFTSQTPIQFSQRYLTLGSRDKINPLPVTWLYFDGKNEGENNVLFWATASEKNNEFFQLERSFDANNWEIMTRIEAAGYSTGKLNYQYTDKQAPFGRVYYRLKQVDFDGKEDFAPNVVSLERGFMKEKETYDFVLYPNPTSTNSFRFRMSTMYDVKTQVWISDLSGKVLSKQYIEVDGSGNSSVVNSNLDPGIYLITVIANDKMRSKPLVITR